MGTVYVIQEDALIGKVEERLTVKVEKEIKIDLPLIKVEGIVVLGRASVSPALISELLERRIPLSYLTKTGRYLGRLEPDSGKNILIRQAQWQAAGESSQAVHLVQGFVRGKLKNYRNSLQRRQRKFSELNLQNAISQLAGIITKVDTIEKIDSLRGLEGAGSAIYFGCFDQLLRNQAFSFAGRNRRPPTDPVNSLLSLGYALLRHDLQSAVNHVGFDPYLGYLHYIHYGRPGLALDLMEEFRPLVVDAIVLDLINHTLLSTEHFISEPISNAVSLTKDGLKIYLKAYEQKKQSSFKHPVFKRQCNYQEAFEIQTRLLGKYLMKELDKYPPLVLK